MGTPILYSRISVCTADVCHLDSPKLLPRPGTSSQCSVFIGINEQNQQLLVCVRQLPALPANHPSFPTIHSFVCFQICVSPFPLTLTTLLFTMEIFITTVGRSSAFSIETAKFGIRSPNASNCTLPVSPLFFFDEFCAAHGNGAVCQVPTIEFHRRCVAQQCAVAGHLSGQIAVALHGDVQRHQIRVHCIVQIACIDGRLQAQEGREAEGELMPIHSFIHAATLSTMLGHSSLPPPHSPLTFCSSVPPMHWPAQLNGALPNSARIRSENMLICSVD